MATENNNKTLNVPNLRFPEFSGEWTKTLLNNYLEENKERNKRGIFTKNHVLSVSGDFGIVNQIELLGRSFAGKSVLDYHVVRTGNVVYTKSPLKEYPYGIVKVNGGVDGIVSTLYAVYKVKETANGKFVEYYFGLPNRTNRYFKPIVRIGAKHDMKIGNDEVLANYVVFPCVDEQKRISDFICLLDERIATQIKIIEKLESLIKGLCQKLTQQGNSNTALNETLVCYSSTLQESSVQEAGNYPVYGATGVCGYTDTPEVDGDSILIIKDGASVGVTYYASGKYSAIGTLNRLVAKRGYSLRYLYYCLKVFNFAPYRTGLAIPHIYFRDYGKAKVWCPSLDEQQRIADALTNVEQKIAIEKSLLEQLYSQKRFLLQAMFI
jgi:type I restriction enzyme S subunit